MFAIKRATIMAAGVAAGMLLMLAVQAGEHEGKAEGGTVHELIVTGKNVCLGCKLKERGAGAQCDVYGHRHGLKVKQVADKDGQPLDKPGLVGSVLPYLDNDRSKDLLGGHHGEKITVTGKLYKPERVLEVISFKVEEASEPAAGEE